MTRCRLSHFIFTAEKNLTEQYLTRRAKEDGFSFSIVRVCGVFGMDAIEKGVYTSLQKLVLKKSCLCRLNWPGRISSIYVEDMAWFLHELINHKPGEGRAELYIPSVQAPAIWQMCEAYAKAYGIDRRGIVCPGWIWAALEWLTGRKRFWEKVLPHKIYNTVWQDNIMVGQGIGMNRSRVPRSLGLDI